ncbi:hypothetical protein EDD31_2766 [Bogoriella caseilytica]|uniref:Uncharacterized protein n=1 Tax=Bogoriella caseilytica TaxID=56055 RepID=A0A3N2BGG5_9MICO|nr:hypothetical protein EDD31_2766 [Bogoriella caseilytica]
MFGVSDVRTWMEATREPGRAAGFPGGAESARG